MQDVKMLEKLLGEARVPSAPQFWMSCGATALALVARRHGSWSVLGVRATRTLPLAVTELRARSVLGSPCFDDMACVCRGATEETSVPEGALVAFIALTAFKSR